MMQRLDYGAARRIAEAHLATMAERIGEPLALHDNPNPVERGYLFHYNLPEVVGGETSFGLVGNLPFLVTHDGEIEEPPP